MQALLRNLRSVTKILTPERLKNRVLPLLASCLHDSNWRTRDSFFLEVRTRTRPPKARLIHACSPPFFCVFMLGCQPGRSNGSK
jgi:hypothetical protein